MECGEKEREAEGKGDEVTTQYGEGYGDDTGRIWGGMGSGREESDPTSCHIGVPREMLFTIFIREFKYR